MSNDRILDINPSNEEIEDSFRAACKAMPIFVEGHAGNEVNQWLSDLSKFLGVKASTTRTIKLSLLSFFYVGEEKLHESEGYSLLQDSES